MTGESGGASARPNILLIMADQFSAHALSCAGAEHLSTPNLDKLAADGTRFERAYVTFPLCVPSRSSMLTGMMPHQLGIEGNKKPPGEGFTEPSHGSDSLAHLITDAGYESIFAGKWHARKASASSEDGAGVLRPFGDDGLAEACATWISGRGAADAPFFLTASFDDPHTICEYARNVALPYGDIRPVETRHTPPLPVNFGNSPYEPEALRHEQRMAAQMYGTGQYDHDDWRHYRYAYARLVERADRNIGLVLDALEDAGMAENTVVIFTSDHGDGDASHSWNQKTALYEEIVRVPLIMRWPHARPAVSTDLVSVGLDLLPTLCAIVGTSAPPGLGGRDLDPAGPQRHERHDQVVVETAFERDAPPFSRGRSVITDQYKYTVYSWGRWREQLHDLQRDPQEMRNLAVESVYQGVLEDMRTRLMEWCIRTDDGKFLKALVLPRNSDPAVRQNIFRVPY